MKVIMKRPGEAAQIGELPNSEFRKFIGGCLETVSLGGSSYRVVCNDSFLLDDSKYNCTIEDTVYFGNIFLCRIEQNDEGEYDLTGLSDKDFIYLTRLLVESDIFGNASDFCPGDRIFDVCIGEGTVLQVLEKIQEVIIQYDNIDKPSVVDRFYGLKGLYKL